MAEWITAEELTQKLSGHDEAFLLLDVRLSPQGGIPGSRHISVIDLEDGDWPWPVDQHFVVYCQFGKGSSDYAAEVLEEKGYRHVLKLRGGLDAWRALEGKGG